MSCPCYDPITFGHQNRKCARSLLFALDDMECYLRVQRDGEQRNSWYTEEALKRQELGIVPEPDPWPQARLPILRRTRYAWLRVFHSIFA